MGKSNGMVVLNDLRMTLKWNRYGAEIIISEFGKESL